MKTHSISRRRMLQSAAALTATGALLLPKPSQGALFERKKPLRGRIKQSIVQWCFETCGDKWDIEKLCQITKELGLTSIELIPAKQYPILQKHGLTCAICQIDLDPPFLRGFNNPAYWPIVTKATKDAIDAAAQYGYPNVICFTGYSPKDVEKPNGEQISREEGAKNCVEGLKQVIGYAEQKKVNLCMEMLNSRDTSHPMKGHPGYQGDHTDYCIDIIKQVGSPRMKILFDVYHVQIMDGDVVKRIHQHKDYIGHVHVAGNPGRNEPDKKQEINFPPIMQALLDVNYTGYVGIEYIPTRNPLQGLKEAIALCDV